jgi:hypothetical protein
MDSKDFWSQSQMGVHVENPIATWGVADPLDSSHIEMVVDTKKFNFKFFLFVLYALLLLVASVGIVLLGYIVSYLSYLCSFYPAIGLIRIAFSFFEIAFYDQGLYNYTYKQKENENTN